MSINSLMTEKKIFLDPALNLTSFAEWIDIAPYQLSKLINERFGKSFTNLINEYRVNEFIDRLNDPSYKDHSIYGIALDSGFKSKSSFNSAFKKITGKTPSEYKLK